MGASQQSFSSAQTSKSLEDQSSARIMPPPLATDTTIPSELTEQIKQYQERLKELKFRGYSFEVAPGITYSSEGEGASWLASDFVGKWMSNNNSQAPDTKYSVYEVDNPLSVLCLNYKNQLEKPIELAAAPNAEDDEFGGVDKVKLFPYHVTVSVKDGKPEIQVFDYLNPSNPMVCSMTGDRAPDEALLKLKDHHFESLRSKEIYLSSMEATKGISAFDLYKDRPMSEDETTAVVEMLKKYSVNIEAEKRNVEVDQLGQDIKLELSDWKKGGQNPFLVNGQVSQIILSRKLKSDEISALPLDPKEACKKRELVDQYGNMISRTLMGNLENEKDPDNRVATELIIINPPTPFATTAEEAKEKTVLNFDASALGGPKINGFLYRYPEAPVKEESNYRIYSNMDPSITSGLSPDATAKLAKGAKKVETLFGITLGSQIKNIHIVNSASKNARFRPKDKETIVIYDELLKKQSDNLINTAVHEGTHLLDEYTGGKLSDGAFKKSWENFDSSFFQQINESKFVGNSGAGHSQDSSKELLASTIVSLTQENWNEKVQTLEADIRENYLESLKSLQTNLSATTTIPSNAPIHEVIREKVKFLQTLNNY